MSAYEDRGQELEVRINIEDEDYVVLTPDFLISDLLLGGREMRLTEMSNCAG